MVKYGRWSHPNGETANFASLIEALGSDDPAYMKEMGRRERKAAQTRLRLFRCAIRLFAERGFSNVTVEDITEAADVGKGTFFNYFKSKDQVLSVIAEVQLGKVRHALQSAEAGACSIRLVLHHLFIQASQEYGRSPQFARTLLNSYLTQSPRSQDIGDVRRMLSRIFKLGQERGEIDSALTPEQLATHLQQSSFGTVLLWSLRGGPNLHTAVEASFQHFWRAISFR